MGLTLDSILPSVLGGAPSGLLTREAVAQVRRNASALPPVYRGILECRLAEGQERVDLHQSLIGKGEEPLILRKHIAQSLLGGDVRWARIYEFCREWGNPAHPLYSRVSSVWMEYDLLGKSAALPIPSIFLTFSGGRQSYRDDVELQVAVASALNILSADTDSDGMLSTLEACVDACPDNTSITHIGFMFPRGDNVLRINVAGLAREQLEPFLEQVGWRAEQYDYNGILSQLFNHADRVVVCLDLDRGLRSRLGLECFFDNQPEEGARWDAFLSGLVEAGLCTGPKKEALLKWPGIIEPASEHQTWPADLIIQSLMGPPDRFSVVHRKLSHVKIDLDPGKSREAKGYLWFAHSWIDLARAGQPENDS